jgi:tetratricopeptide (TPR) repeat protein
LAAANEVFSMRYQHAVWCRGLVAEAEQGLRGPDQPEWLNRLELEHNNIRVALGWLQTVPELATLCLTTAAPLWRFWAAHGHVHEGRDWLDRVLNATVSTAPGPGISGDEQRAWLSARAAVLSGAGNLAEYGADLPRSRALHEEALSMRRSLGDPTAVASSLGNLANTAAAQGDLAAAASWYGEALPLFRGQANTWAVAACLSNLGPIVMDLGDLDCAHALLHESLALRRELRDTWGIAVSLKSLGAIALERGQLGSAEELQQEALALRRALGDQRAVAESLACCAAVASSKGQAVTAWIHLQEAISLSRELGDKIGLAFELLEIARVLAALDQPSGAAHVIAAFEQFRRTLGVALPPSHERRRSQIQNWCASRLTSRALEDACASGAARSLESILTWIVESPAPQAETPLAIP